MPERLTLSRVPVWLLNAALFLFCHAATLVFSACRWAATFCMRPQPPSALLPPPSAKTSSELVAALEAELGPRTFPEHLRGGTVAFAPCSNLCVYGFGAAACLQRARGFQAKDLVFRGVSSGSLIAAALAMEVDIVALFETSVHWLDAINYRVGGWVGAYSETITGIVRDACALAGGEQACERLPAGRLEIGATELAPLPRRLDFKAYTSNHELEVAILSSCYIPVVWERPIWMPGRGLAVDGGASAFVSVGDLVVGPYHSGFPDIGPKKEFPRHLVFSPVARPDMLRLFEEGFRDAAAWLERGDRQADLALAEKREQLAANGSSALLSEAWGTLLEVLGIKKKSG